MFNLVMFSVDWTSGRVSIPRDRVLEYTEEHIKNYYIKSGIPQLDILRKLPCLFCNEGMEQEKAYVGRIVQATIVGDSINLDISFDRDVPTLHNALLFENRNDLNMPQTFEFSRNHWAVKDIDLYHFLLRNTRPNRQKPTVFTLAEPEVIDSTLLSAMMPFDEGFKKVHNAIVQSAKDTGLNCKRADDLWEAHSIIQDVVSLIDRSRVVVCDCSGKNPNVFYEAGIAHTLGRDVILITQSEHDIPFDLRHLRYIKYLNNKEGLADLRQKLVGRIKTIIGR